MRSVVVLTARLGRLSWYQWAMLVTLDVFDDDHGYLLLWDIFALVYAFTFLASVS